MKRRLPLWAMGLAIAPMGFYYGYVSTAIPILLSARGVSTEEISRVSAIGFSPTFWSFLLCPILGVWYSKRTYAMFLVALAALCLVGSTFLLGNLKLFTAVVTLGCAGAALFSSAVLAWLVDVIDNQEYDEVGGWNNVANLGAAGVFSLVTVVLIRKTSPAVTSVLLAAVMLVPTVLLFLIPLPATAARSAAEAFRTMWGDVKLACRRPGFGLGLLCFLSPTACFALTNIFSGLGRDYAASESWVTLINGPVVALVCSVGCLVAIPVCRRMPRRIVYVVAGFGGGLAALAMIAMPHTAAYYAAGVLAYNFFQGMNYTAYSAFSYEIAGPGNPLAATQMGLLGAGANGTITYMTLVDGHFRTTHGLNGMFAVDGLSSLAVGAVLLGVFWVLGRRKPRAQGVAAEASGVA